MKGITVMVLPMGTHWVSSNTKETRRYPRGIQILVSTYLLGAEFEGGVVFWASQN